jgi:hypothetical protein
MAMRASADRYVSAQLEPVAPVLSQYAPVEQLGVVNEPVAVFQYEPEVPFGIAHAPVDDQK